MNHAIRDGLQKCTGLANHTVFIRNKQVSFIQFINGMQEPSDPHLDGLYDLKEYIKFPKSNCQTISGI